MESDQPQDQQGLPHSDSAFLSSARSSANQFLVPQASLQPFQLGLGNLSLQSFGQFANPYLTAHLPQLSTTFGSHAGISATAEFQRYQQLLSQQPPVYTVPPGPPSEEDAAAANTAEITLSGAAARSAPSTPGERQQSVSAVRRLGARSDQRSPSVKR